MVKTHYQKIIKLSLIFIIFSVLGCQLDIPIKEMVMAKKSITRAKEVKADKYDPDNLDKAINHLYTCHNLLKKNKSKDAREEAKKAYRAASLAIKNSLPKLSTDTLAEAKDIFSQAEKLYAEKFAPDDFTNAQNLINEATALDASESYWSSYLKSSKAIVFASEAKNKSIDNIPKLKEEITRISSEISELKNHPSASIIQNDLTELDSKINEADKNLLENKIKPAFENITDASKLLEKTKLKIAIIDAREKIIQLRKNAEELKNKRGADFSSEELEKVFSLLNEADTLLDEENSTEALKKITEAEEALIAATKKTLKGIAEERIKNVEKLYEQVSSNNKQEELQKELDKASTLISDAKNHFNNNLFEESINKSDEAETILNSFLVSKEKDLLKNQGMDTGDGKILTVYVVIYNKNKRDCLWRIAYKVYKNAKLWPLIYVANKNQIKDPDLIFPGQRFKIPAIPDKSQDRNEETVKKEDNAVIDENTGNEKMKEDKTTGETNIEKTENDKLNPDNNSDKLETNDEKNEVIE